ncbi:MAG: NAD(P)-binding protein [Planctomycetes bacterium]|nr:NAD(P)-binding protein [Planctomycetota bacterium]
MPIRLSNLRLPIEESEQALVERMTHALGVPRDALAGWRILRKSLDLRDKRDLAFVYSTEVALRDDERAGIDRVRRRDRSLTAELHTEPPFELPPPGTEPLAQPPVIVGSGPAGLFAALLLAEHGYRPLVLERGTAVRDRIVDVERLESGGPHDPESNYLFGEGGAGTFSDGKLTCRNTGPDVRRVLELFAEHKGKPGVIYEHRPHLGSNRLPAIVKALRQRTIALGGEFRFRTRVEDLDLSEGRLRALMTSAGTIPAHVAVLAIGHSARDTFEMLLRRGVPMEAKAFQFGVRIEQPQAQINRVQYGENQAETILGPADYSLVAHGSRDLFTFCMCAGGQVIPSVSEPGRFCTNGMSLSRRASPWANSGLMVTIEPAMFGSPHTLAGIELQRHYEGLALARSRGELLCPIQNARDFLARRLSSEPLSSSYRRGVVATQLAELLPPAVIEALDTGLPLLDRRWRGKFLDQATLVGPEARGSSPVRLPRDKATLESTGVVGLYPSGEGAGYAGGIVSAAVDGLRVAKAVMARYAPLEPRR